jgi:hypothetical protein
MDQLTVRAYDQGEWSRYGLNSDGTFWSIYTRYEVDPTLPVATMPFNGAPLLNYAGAQYHAAVGPNVFD